MAKKSTKITGMTLVALIIAVISYFNDHRSGNADQSSGTTKHVNTRTQENTRSQSGVKLDYTRHAKCRMGCRTINYDEVREVYTRGKINPKKSNPSGKPCPTEAKEYRTQSGQLIRGIFASCRSSIKVITVIDLENKYECNC